MAANFAAAIQRHRQELYPQPAGNRSFPKSLPSQCDHAADGEYTFTDPANAAKRDEFKMNTFPPNNHALPA